MTDLMQRIQYAKTKSDCIAKEEGSYVPREKKKKQEEKGKQWSLWFPFKWEITLFSDCVLRGLAFSILLLVFVTK